ncbi:MAG: YjbQ family protein [Actinobacteria bacterium]|nr:YjbQ family protein [Actinomycetota bacterium]
MSEVSIDTQSEIDVVDVTETVAEAFSGVGTGIGHIFTPHTTAAVIICEDDPNLHDDLRLVAREWLAGIGPFRHIRENNPNTVAHVLSAFASAHVAVPVKDGALDLGTYQHVLLLDFDGPRTRRLRFQFVPSEPMER